MKTKNNQNTNLEKNFGHNGKHAKTIIQLLSGIMRDTLSETIAGKYDQWCKKIFSLYGSPDGESIEKERQNLVRQYGLMEDIEFGTIFFSLQTYFSILLKFFSCSTLEIYKNKLGVPCHCQKKTDGFISFLQSLENGSYYKRHSIMNYVDQTMFSWYLNAMSDDLLSNLWEMYTDMRVHQKEIYELKSSLTDPFQSLYHALLPAKLRHSLGEYYTPPWMAELIIREIGYEGDPDKKVLDPACGSGIFLILAIQSFLENAYKKKIQKEDWVSKVCQSICGMDINPLAVLSAKTNYLLQIAPFLNKKEQIEIPVYTMDSVLDTPKYIRTSENNHLCFDYLVGNPPWIRWDYLLESYRRVTLPLWKNYGLFSLTGFDSLLGGGKKDLSMLFTLSTVDRFLKKGGKIGYVITKEVFQTKGAGEGFRKSFTDQAIIPIRIQKIHDLSRFQPFNETSNKTTILIAIKGEKTQYPVPYYKWDALHKTNYKLNADCLQSIEKACKIEKWLTKPLNKPNDPFQILSTDNTMENLLGECPYKAYLGVNANPYGIFWIKIKRKLAKGLIRIENMPDKGKLNIRKVETTLEQKCVFPGLRGRDIKRWKVNPSIYLLIVQDPVTRKGINTKDMEEMLPKTFDYLESFKEELQKRALYKRFYNPLKDAYYSQFNVSTQTFSPYKTVWGRLSTDIAAAVVSSRGSLMGEKPLLPTETVSFFPCQSEEEAHYLCALINSKKIRHFIRSFSAAGRGFATPSVFQHVNIPVYQSGNSLHQTLVKLSIQLHFLSDMTKSNPQSTLEIKNLENLLEETVEKLF